MAAVKAKEKEMKDEKEAERQVSALTHHLRSVNGTRADRYAEEDTSYQRQAGCEGGEGALRAVGRDYAPEASREIKEEGKEK
jgi:hypothetical protein